MPSSAPPLFASWKVDHAAIRVPDFDAAVAWYSDKLGFRLRNSVPLGGKTYGWLEAPGSDNDFIIELVAGPGAQTRPGFDDLPSSLKQYGWHHLCFRVDSVDDAVSELRRRDVSVISEPHDVAAIGFRVAFFADPWGNVFEVLHATKAQQIASE